MVKYRTCNDIGSARFFAPVGSRLHQDYEITVDKVTGHKTVKPAGFTDVYAKIQAAKPACEIDNILKRAAAGDPLALAQTNGQYLDCTDMPTTLAEALNTINKLEQAFERLPLDVRRQYGFSASRFIAAAGSGQLSKEVDSSASDEQSSVSDKVDG